MSSIVLHAMINLNCIVMYRFYNTAIDNLTGSPIECFEFNISTAVHVQCNAQAAATQEPIRLHVDITISFMDSLLGTAWVQGTRPPSLMSLCSMINRHLFSDLRTIKSTPPRVTLVQKSAAQCSNNSTNRNGVGCTSQVSSDPEEGLPPHPHLMHNWLSRDHQC